MSLPNQSWRHGDGDTVDVFDSILGRGAFGDVYEGSLVIATHTTAVAVKVLHALFTRQ